MANSFMLTIKCMLIRLTSPYPLNERLAIALLRMELVLISFGVELQCHKFQSRSHMLVTFLKDTCK